MMEARREAEPWEDGREGERLPLEPSAVNVMELGEDVVDEEILEEVVAEPRIARWTGVNVGIGLYVRKGVTFWACDDVEGAALRVRAIATSWLRDGVEGGERATLWLREGVDDGERVVLSGCKAVVLWVRKVVACDGVLEARTGVDDSCEMLGWLGPTTRVDMAWSQAATAASMVRNPW